MSVFQMCQNRKKNVLTNESRSRGGGLLRFSFEDTLSAVFFSSKAERLRPTRKDSYDWPFGPMTFILALRLCCVGGRSVAQPSERIAKELRLQRSRILHASSPALITLNGTREWEIALLVTMMFVIVEYQCCHKTKRSGLTAVSFRQGKCDERCDNLDSVSDHYGLHWISLMILRDVLLPT